MDNGKRFRVQHHEYGTTEVTAVDRLRAVVAAAREWGVRWTAIGRACTVMELGEGQEDITETKEEGKNGKTHNQGRYRR